MDFQLLVQNRWVFFFVLQLVRISLPKISTLRRFYLVLVPYPRTDALFASGKLKVTELFFEVPLDYSNAGSGTIQIFARSATRHEQPAAPSAEEERRKQKPWYVIGVHPIAAHLLSL